MQSQLPISQSTLKALSNSHQADQLSLIPAQEQQKNLIQQQNKNQHFQNQSFKVENQGQQQQQQQQQLQQQQQQDAFNFLERSKSPSLKEQDISVQSTPATVSEPNSILNLRPQSPSPDRSILQKQNPIIAHQKSTPLSNINQQHPLDLNPPQRQIGKTSQLQQTNQNFYGAQQAQNRTKQGSDGVIKELSGSNIGGRNQASLQNPNTTALSSMQSQQFPKRSQTPGPTVKAADTSQYRSQSTLDLRLFGSHTPTPGQEKAIQSGMLQPQHPKSTLTQPIEAYQPRSHNQADTSGMFGPPKQLTQSTPGPARSPTPFGYTKAQVPQQQGHKKRSSNTTSFQHPTISNKQQFSQVGPNQSEAHRSQSTFYPNKTQQSSFPPRGSQHYYLAKGSQGFNKFNGQQALHVPIGTPPTQMNNNASQVPHLQNGSFSSRTSQNLSSQYSSQQLLAGHPLRNTSVKYSSRQPSASYPPQGQAAFYSTQSPQLPYSSLGPVPQYNPQSTQNFRSANTPTTSYGLQNPQVSHASQSSYPLRTSQTSYNPPAPNSSNILKQQYQNQNQYGQQQAPQNQYGGYRRMDNQQRSMSTDYTRMGTNYQQQQYRGPQGQLGYTVQSQKYPVPSSDTYGGYGGFGQGNNYYQQQSANAYGNYYR